MDEGYFIIFRWLVTTELAKFNKKVNNLCWQNLYFSYVDQMCFSLLDISTFQRTVKLEHFSNKVLRLNQR